MKVIFHVDELEKWSTALTNIKNLIDYCETEGVEREIELLANGEAVKFLTTLPVDSAKAAGLEGAVADLAGRQVTVAACNNALNKYQIGRELLLPCVTVVPAGVVELAVRQEQGFAYIKP